MTSELPTRSKNPKEETLYGLRGIPIIYVLVSHVGNAGLPLFPIPHNAIGKVGVWIFFTLSAFLLTSNLVHRLRTSQSRLRDIVGFTIHRAFRIYPLYTFVLLLHIPLAGLSYQDALKHLLLIEGREELWAIPVEFTYYLCIPLIAMGFVWCTGRGDRVATMLFLAALPTLAILSTATCEPSSIFSNDLALTPKLTPFLFGSLLALLVDRRRTTRTAFTFVKPTIVSGFALTALVMTTLIYRDVHTKNLYTNLTPWLSLALSFSASGLLFSALYDPYLRAILRFRPLGIIGKISFSLYLLHMFFISAVSSFSGIPAALQSWLCILSAMPASLISFYLIERPGIHFGRYLANRVTNPHTSHSRRTLDRAPLKT
jgi:peptidoglycan/LPS O-acetylase OafA/YrhL